MTKLHKHDNHPLILIEGKFGPHKGKFVCKLCNIWVKWTNEHEVKIYKEINQERTRNKKVKKAMA